MIDITSRALLHLEDAELAILSHIGAESVALQQDEAALPDLTPMLYAVLRSIARAAGLLEGMPTSEQDSADRLALTRDGAGQVCRLYYEGVEFVPWARAEES